MAEAIVENVPTQKSTLERPTNGPVFVNRTELKFYIEEKMLHYRVLIIYNPYAFPVVYRIYFDPDQKGRYRVHWCSSPIIAPHDSAQVSIVDSNADDYSKCDLSTTFVVIMANLETLEVIGKKCITGKLVSILEIIQSICKVKHNHVESDEEDENETTINGKRYSTLFRVLICLATILLLTFLLPPEDEWSIIDSSLTDILKECFFLTYERKTNIVVFFGVTAILLWDQLSNHISECVQDLMYVENFYRMI